MAVEKLVGPPRKLAKFISLVLTLLMVGATFANILYGQYALAVATAIIGAWALLVFAELFKGEMVEAIRGAPADAPDQDEHELDTPEPAAAPHNPHEH